MNDVHVLFSIYHTQLYSFSIDNIINSVKEGNNVTVYYCDGIVKRCPCNVLAFKSICYICKSRSKYILSQISGIHFFPYRSLINEVKKQKFIFKSEDEFLKIQYKEINIATPILSDYITTTRNLKPLYNTKLIKYFNKLIDSTCIYVDIAYSIADKNPDFVSIANGRLFDARPFVDVFKKYKINFICEETAVTHEGITVKENFINKMPILITSFNEKIHNAWDNSNISIEKRIEIGKLFFKRRCTSQYTGEKIYTYKQIINFLPTNWDNNKINISFFNSSEDEFASIGKEFKTGKIFNSQIEGIKAILELYKNDKRYYFYLRIHPNLSKIMYKYHTELLALNEEYNNLTVISGNSPVSTYTLINNSDKVIVFGSTIGVESCYFGKPVLLLYPSIYQELNIAYRPNTIDDIKDFISGKINFIGNKLDAIKYAYCIYNSERYTSDNDLCKLQTYTVIFFGKKYTMISMDYYGNSPLRMRCLKFLDLVRTYIEKKIIPNKEE